MKRSKTIISLSMETYAGYRTVIYFRNGFDEYYMIDLESFPEKLSPITNFTAEQMKVVEQRTAVEQRTGWSVIDECIGGIQEEKGKNIFTVGLYNIHAN
ncbi:hypothetical protein H5410_002284 [Solanum commersonii]|uniref:Uncharacterized protein n=1 Tax=Solanum commersonii TaxID=4109 RepID=A0A9J6B2G1_SOLCO|nr:hypothetical protein H5410_002284 [Solanum commersonii]